MRPILPTTNRRNQRRGFTLLELMLAITLGSLVLGVVYSTFSVGIDTQRRIARVAGETQAWRFFSERLRADVKNLVVAEAATLSGGAQTLTLQSVLPNQARQEISYRYQRGSSGGQIRRRTRAAADQLEKPQNDNNNYNNGSEGFETLVFDGVERFALRYLIDDDWRDQAGSNGADPQAEVLLRALECTVRSGGRERQLVIAIEVQRAPG